MKPSELPVEKTNILIIGSGPAGLTAALYAARAELQPIIVEGAQAGGQLTITTDVENYPGFPEGVMGPDLMVKFREQAGRFGTRMYQDDVVELDLSKRPFTARTDTHKFEGQAVILAMGARAKLLGIPSETELMGFGVSACATCDGFFAKGHEIAVVGGGDTAMEEATFLTRFAKSVTIVHRRDSLRASKIMQERAFTNEKIRFLWDSEVIDIEGDNKVSGLKIRNTVDGTESHLDVTGLFVAIGHDPRSELFEHQLRRDDEGYLLVDAPSTKTNLVGVFACGDVVDHTYRQAVTAAGTGCAAALDAERYLAGMADSVSTGDPAQVAQAILG
jgi:thioredoxin reductase (NADPH)